jgi:hypothetical protein
MIRVAVDIGGVLSKNPSIWRPILRALQFDESIELWILTDMYDPDATYRMLCQNGFGFIPRSHVLNSDFEQYGEACKAVLCRKYRIDVMIDDFPAYVAEGAPVRLLCMPDIREPYYHDDWKSDGLHGDFGRRKRVEAALEVENA